MKSRFALLLGTFFYLGYSPIAPGTVGTAGAILIYYLLTYFSQAIYFLFLLGFIILSVRVSTKASAALEKADPGQVVIDEVCGYLVTMFLIPTNSLNIVLGFFLFRFFDVLKPPPVRRLENLPSGLGIVADDVAAGIYANIVLHIITKLLDRIS